MQANIPPSFDHYRVSTKPDGSLWILGRGGMGVTYRATDMKLGREVALKVIDSNRLMDEAARHRFLREAKTNAMLHHRNLAAVFHQGQVGDSCYYAMELIEGKTLQEILKERGAIPPLEALEITRQAAQALSEAEKHGLVHRDVKPANLMIKLESDGQMLVKLIDFGLVKAIVPDDRDDTQITIDGGFLGTAMTSSPEQCRGEDLDSRSDIYGLGIVLWNMVEGRPPFEDPNHFRLMMAHLESPLPLERLASFPGPLVDLIACMLAKNRADRPANTGDLLERIDAARKAVEHPEAAPAPAFRDPALETPAPAAPPEEPAEEPVGGFPYGTAAAVVLALTAGFVAYRLKQHRDARANAPTEAITATPGQTLPGESGGGFLASLNALDTLVREGDWASAIPAAVALMPGATTGGRRREVETAVEALSARLLAQPDLTWADTVKADAVGWRAWLETGAHPAAKLVLVRALRGSDAAASSALLAKVDPASLTDLFLRLEYAAALHLAATDAAARAGAEEELAKVLGDVDRLTGDAWRRGLPALRDLARAGHVPTLLLLGQKSADPAEAQTMLMDAAQRLDQGGQWARALSVYLDLLRANRDPALAPLVRGRMESLARGFLDRPDSLPAPAFAAAQALLEEAGQAGVASAAELVAVRTLPTDPATAIPWYTQAAKAGSASAMTQLSLLLDQGTGVPVNREQSREWLEKAAAAGHGGAQLLLAQRLQANKDPASLRAAAALLEKAAARSIPPAQEALADVLRRGQGAPADPARALQLYQQAADAGQLRAYASLSAMVTQGEGGAPDPARGLALLQKGADAGDGWCQYLLGKALWAGQDLAADQPRAAQLLRAAAKAGIGEARALCEQNGIPLP